jgi:HEAT repeat protein
MVSVGDISEVPNIVRILRANSATENQKIWLVHVISNDITDERAIPAIVPLTRSNDAALRSVAMQALWHMRSSASIPQLALALSDPDRDVRFYAVRALADIANQSGWGGPGEGEFQENEQKYLSHWREWILTQPK